MFNTVNSVYEWLFNAREKNRKKDLTRITSCINDLDLRPTYPIIHVAGTNGKGSTACYIKNILKNTGRHVGLFISPFVISFNERIEINDRYISDAEIMHYGSILFDYAKKYEETFKDIIPFFELTLLMALMYYKDRKIDLGIFECGIGGKLDATNALSSDLAIITSIGYDHQNVLGNTLESIAEAKLGIVKDKMKCLCNVDETLKPLFKEYGLKHQAEMIFVDEAVKIQGLEPVTSFTYQDESFSTPLLSAYQAYNASLAIACSRIIDKTIPSFLIADGLNQTVFPGRMEVVRKTPLVILDGAHNISAIIKQVEFLKKILHGRTLKIVFSCLKDKNYSLMLKELDKITSFYYFTTIDDERKMEETVFAKETTKPYQLYADVNTCLSEVLKDLTTSEVLVITGSLHFVSIVRKFFVK